MRWIDKREVEGCLNQEWRDKAALVLTKLMNANSQEERKRILKRETTRQVWRDFYELMPDHLKKKCWYCEAEDIRSDHPVDHFRPKGQVAECEEHTGYWWLAVDWENYRCACTYCNSIRTEEDTEGGKQDQFPLYDETKRAMIPDDNISAEEPAILDPFINDDCRLLWFDLDGKPDINPRKVTEHNQQKIDNSISVYHLDASDIVRKRNDLRIEINEEVQALREAVEEGSARTVQRLKTNLERRIQNSQKLSRAAQVYLMAHRDLDEVDDILTP